MPPSISLGIPVPKLLPITGTWTLPFASYLLLLSNRVVMTRLKNEHYLGDKVESDKSQSDPDYLNLTTRAHANFLENVPLAFILAAIAELNGADRRILNYGLGALLALRVAHVEIGMFGKNTVGPGRPVGYYGTQAWLLGVAAYSTYLVKGYWGF